MDSHEYIILVGGGGHCKSCIDVIESQNLYKIHGILDLKKNIGNYIFTYKIIESDESINKLSKKCKNFLITVGQIKEVDTRKRIGKILESNHVNLPIIKSPHAYVSRNSTINPGTILMHYSFVNSGSSIGKNCIINSGAKIEHDVDIGDFCHISTNAMINGGCSIGSDTFIGSNTVIKNDISICEKCVIGAGSIILNNIKKPGIYFGKI